MDPMSAASGEGRAKTLPQLSPMDIKTSMRSCPAFTSLIISEIHHLHLFRFVSPNIVMSHPLQKIVYTGTFISTPKLDTLDIAEHQAVGVDEDGVIRHKSDLSPDGSRHDQDNLEIKVKAIAVAWGWGEEGWKWVQGGKEGQSWWFPGFVGECFRI